MRTATESLQGTGTRRLVGVFSSPVLGRIARALAVLVMCIPLTFVTVGCNGKSAQAVPEILTLGEREGEIGNTTVTFGGLAAQTLSLSINLPERFTIETMGTTCSGAVSPAKGRAMCTIRIKRRIGSVTSNVVLAIKNQDRVILGNVYING
jgi:hypothetical protein